MGKDHGSLNHAGKVRALTPKVPKTDHPTPAHGRVSMRKKYNKRFLSRNPDENRHLNPQD
jgi:ribosomal protein S30